MQNKVLPIHFCSSRLQQQIEDHRVILVASSPFFQTIFQKNKQGSTDQNVINETKEDVLPYQSKETSWTNQSSTESRPASTNKSSKSDRNALVSQTIELMYGDLQELDQTVNSMMETSQNMIEAGNRKTTAKICKACVKEGHPTNIKRHIELYHLEGVSIPCNNCEKTFRSRNTLQKHVSTLHNNVTV